MPEGQCHHSHSPNQFNSPSCKFYQRGIHTIIDGVGGGPGGCQNPNCIYSHKLELKTPLATAQTSTTPNTNSNVIKEPLICRPFAINGYCDNGRSCPYIHYFQCPDYLEFGYCMKGTNCKLQHDFKKGELSSKNEFFGHVQPMFIDDNENQDDISTSDGKKTVSLPLRNADNDDVGNNDDDDDDDVVVGGGFDDDDRNGNKKANDDDDDDESEYETDSDLDVEINTGFDMMKQDGDDEALRANDDYVQF
ncbi:unnamed protein product [Ambrosiozyma monospora]|uniref:Unnamed protein product n=1 Tax=Ambrosiozyma monospora TaxID=43982 RepID=A0A9W6YQX8_AMBMO|nr:unnamed protein product [Ambrosiozyma monospora]